MPDADALLRELNHRVNNNFQIIVSLMNLKKRLLPPDRREDIRFIQEHVQSMSVAFRLAYAGGSMVDVSLPQLVADVLFGLRETARLDDARLDEERLRVDDGGVDARIGLDQAIALALYMAVALPPYLDQAAATGGAVTVSVDVTGDSAVLTVRGDSAEPVVLDFLRSRLMQAYIGQLQAEIGAPAGPAGQQLRFAIDPPRGK